MTSTPLLEGFGVRLEPVSEQHIAALEAVATDPTIWRHMPLKIQTAEDVRAWVQQAVESDQSDSLQIWVTKLTGSGEIAGSTRLLDLNPQHRTGEIGFTWLAAKYRGAGVNPRVKLLQLTHAFETLGLRRVALKTHHENVQSQRGILKLGAKFEGTFRNHMIMPDSSTRHTMWYSMVAEEWPEIKIALLSRMEAEPLRPRED